MAINLDQLKQKTREGKGFNASGAAEKLRFLQNIFDRAAKTAEGEEVKYVRYDNGIYRYGADGKTEKYTVDTDYHFIIYAADDGFVIGRLMYKLDDGVITPFDTLEYDHIRIDLSTGQIQLLKLYAL